MYGTNHSRVSPFWHSWLPTLCLLGGGVEYVLKKDVGVPYTAMSGTVGAMTGAIIAKNNRKKGAAVGALAGLLIGLAADIVADRISTRA